MATKAKSKKSAVKMPLLPARLKLDWSRATIAILSIAIVGVSYLLVAQGATSYSVRFIYRCASDSCNSSYSAASLSSAAKQVQSWYKAQTGRTFTIASVGSSRSGHSVAWFGSYSGNSAALGWPSDINYNTLANTAADLGIPMSGGNVKTVVLLGFKSLTYCGFTPVGGAMALADNFALPACNNSSGQITMTLAHEFGHTLGLKHVTTNTLMYTSGCSILSLGSGCNLDGTQKSTVYNSYWFAPPPPPPPAWHGWHRLSALLHSAPAVASWGTGRYDLFECANGTVAHKYYQSGWHDWEQLGGDCVGDPAAVSWGSGRIDIFTRGTDNALHHLAWNGSWSAWQSLGGDVTASPAVSSNGAGQLDVYARASDATVHHRSYNGGWSAWESIGGAVTGGVAAVARPSAPTTRVIFAEGTDSTLQNAGYGSQWGTWSSLGGVLTSAPAADSQGTLGMLVFVRGTDNLIHERVYGSGAWGSWTTMSGAPAASAPGVGDWGSSRYDLFVKGSDGYLWQNSWY